MIFLELESLTEFVSQHRENGKQIVLTSGTFDILHVGHARYLQNAAREGEILVVGIDSDAKVKARKGDSRPIVPEDERIEMLSAIRWVDAIYVKPLEDPKWALIQAVKPDTLVISRRSGYTLQDKQALLKYCNVIEELQSQAETSTSARIRDIVISNVSPLVNELLNLQDQVTEIVTKFSQITGGKNV